MVKPRLNHAKMYLSKVKACKMSTFSWEDFDWGNGTAVKGRNRGKGVEWEVWGETGGRRRGQKVGRSEGVAAES